MSRRTSSRAVVEPQEIVAPPAPLRLAVRRIRLRSLARVGFSIGWIISFLPALIFSALAAWILHGIWGTLDGWAPWTPWPRDTRVGPITLPTPEFQPREALRVEGLYQMLEPIGQHPVLGGLLGTLALTAIGGGLVAIIMLLAGAGYNLFSGVTGGLEFELASRPPRRTRDLAAPLPRAGPGARHGREREEDWAWEEDAELRW